MTTLKYNVAFLPLPEQNKKTQTEKQDMLCERLEKRLEWEIFSSLTHRDTRSCWGFLIRLADCKTIRSKNSRAIIQSVNVCQFFSKFFEDLIFLHKLYYFTAS
jgi:hypothetical protein